MGLIIPQWLTLYSEAHCDVKLNHRRIDITNNNADIGNLINDIIEEIEIEPEQVVTFKIDYHKRFLQNWIIENEINLDFEKIWEIRAQCIKRLEH